MGRGGRGQEIRRAPPSRGSEHRPPRNSVAIARVRGTPRRRSRSRRRVRASPRAAPSSGLKGITLARVFAREVEHARILGIHDGGVLRGLVDEDPRLRRGVGLEGGMAVEMVGEEIQEDRAVGAEVLGGLELEARGLGDEDGALVRAVDMRGDGVADVAHRARIEAGFAQHRVQAHRGGALALGSGDADDPALRLRARRVRVRAG